MDMKWLGRDVTLVSHIQQLGMPDGYQVMELQEVTDDCPGCDSLSW